MTNVIPQFVVENAVIVQCSICGGRSRPCDPNPKAKQIVSHPTQKGFEQEHARLHTTEKLIEVATKAGHKIVLDCTCMEPDCIRYQPICSCGWKGREAPTWQAEGQARTHQGEAVGWEL